MATNFKVKKILEKYPRQNFGSKGKPKIREENIKNFKLEHPELFQWFFNAPGGDHSKNLLESDLKVTSTTVLRFTDLMPGTKIRLVFSTTGEFYQDGYKLHEDYEDIIIGATGNYYADGINPVYGIYFIKSSTNTNEYPSSPDGTIAYQYQIPIRSSFNSIKSIETDIGAYAQLVGDIPDVIAHLDCAKEQVTKIAMSRYFKRPVEYLFYKGKDLGKFVEDIYEQKYNDDGRYHDLVKDYKDNLFWGTDYSETFDEKENMEYSPFSFYVLRNSYVTADGMSQDIQGHIKSFIAKHTDDTHTHNAEHMFEKYYIDRYIYAQTAEDMLIERMALAARIAASDDETEKAALEEALAANPLYVLDPIAGKMHKAGEYYIYDNSATSQDVSSIIEWKEETEYSLNDCVKYNGKIYKSLKDNNKSLTSYGSYWKEIGEIYKYNPTIVYNNEPIDLREIQRYELNNLEPTETKLEIGNGVYCDIFYQKVIMNYDFEESDDNLITVKKQYEGMLAALKAKRANGQDPLRLELDLLDLYYSQYNKVLSETIKNWVTRETDLKK